MHPAIRAVPVLARDRIPHAQLPANYKAAQVALRECVHVDQCKDIADKHDALAHYAKQIQDTSLRDYAQRVYARALSRIGELLNQLPNGKARTELAAAQGISRTKAHLAQQLATVPEKILEKELSVSPPEKPHLIAYRHAHRTERGRRAEETRQKERDAYWKAQADANKLPETALLNELNDMVSAWESYGPRRAAAISNKNAIAEIHEKIASVRRWLAEVETCLVD